jgi:hypothetical protein
MPPSSVGRSLQITPPALDPAYRLPLNIIVIVSHTLMPRVTRPPPGLRGGAASPITAGSTAAAVALADRRALLGGVQLGRSVRVPPEYRGQSRASPVRTVSASVSYLRDSRPRCAASIRSQSSFLLPQVSSEIGPSAPTLRASCPPGTRRAM